MSAQSGVIKIRQPVKGRSLVQLAISRIAKDYLTLIALAFLAFITLISYVGAPFIAGALNTDFTDQGANTFLPIGTEGHPLGTDHLGRDQFIRLLYAGQITLKVAFLAAVLSLIIGVSVGVITGYYGGVVDDFVNWVITTLTSVPGLFLLLIISAVFRPTPDTLIFVLAILGWTGTTRLVRGETLSLREREYVQSAYAIGASPIRIMFAHIVPNLLSVVIITLAGDIGGLLLTESALSFLGFGVQPPVPTWGNMLADAQDNSALQRGPHLIIVPGLLITLTVLALFVIGDGLRDAFDPRSQA
jgi:peptide/nickel transport system permease protein